MGEELSTGYRIAIGVFIMVFVFSIGLSLVSIGRNTFNKVTTEIVRPVENMKDTDAFGIATYGKPVPVADVWKLVTRINKSANTASGNGNFVSFSIKQRNAVNPNNWDLLSTQLSALDNYMDRKAYMSWSIDDKTGLYSMEVLLDP